HPGERRPVAHRARADPGGGHGRAVADALVAQDEEALVLLELAADYQREVEEQPADDEIGEAEEEQRRDELHVQSRRRHARQPQGAGVDAVAPEQRDHLAPHVHERREEHLLLPQPVRAEHAARQRERGRRRAHHETPRQGHQSGLGQIGILAQRHLPGAQQQRGDQEPQQLERLPGPARIQDEGRAQHDQPADGERPTVDRDQAVRGHWVSSRRAAASWRTRRSAASTPPAANASTIALPTTTPSASRAVARACAGVLIPNPTASGSALAARTRATCSARSAGTWSRTPVTPRREMRYRKPLAPRTARARRSGVVVGAIRRISASGLACTIASRAGSAPAGKSVSSSPDTPAAAASRTKRSSPKAMSGFK